MIAKLFEFRRLQRALKLSPAELRALQERRLRATVRHAYERVPLYRKLWDAAGVGPEDVRSLEDLGRLPVVTRRQVQEAGREAAARGVDISRCVKLTTSGHSGVPLAVYRTKAELQTLLLVEFRTLLRIGLRARDRLVVLGPEDSRGPHWHERLGLYRTHVIRNGMPLEEQIQMLKRLQPTVLWAYPAHLHTLLHAVDYRLSRIVRPRLLIFSSAVMPAHLKDRLRDDLGCPIFNSYAARETGRIAAECPQQQGLHVNADEVLVECLADPELGASTVVVTTLTARTMPFIRYRLGDLASPVEGRCSCRSAFPRITAPAGRRDDAVRLPSGRLQSPHCFQKAIRRFPEIDQFRTVQDGPAHLTVRVCVKPPWPEERRRALAAAIRQSLEEPMAVDVQPGDFMKRESAKFRDFEYAVKD